MSERSYLDLDGHALQLLLAVAETGSVSKAAQRLGKTQSAVSHGLARLKELLDDPLIVRQGRGVALTARARELAGRGRIALDALERVAQKERFDPAAVEGTFTFAANDYQLETLLIAVAAAMRAAAPGLDLAMIASGFRRGEELRSGACDLMLTPNPPDGAEFVTRFLYEDGWALFHDPAIAPPPSDLDDYLARPHLVVGYGDRAPSAIDHALIAMGKRRRIALKTFGFSAARTLVRGGPLIATLPARLAGAPWGLARATPPLAPQGLRMQMVWNRRVQKDPLNQWVRGLLAAHAKALGPPPAFAAWRDDGRPTITRR